jgi:hypothetical protein
VGTEIEWHITYKLQLYTDDASLFRVNINSIKNSEAVIDAVSSTECRTKSQHKNRCFENVTQFKYLGTEVKNKNLIPRGNEIM